MSRAVLLAAVAVLAASVAVAAAADAKCNMPGETTYPPDASRALPWYTINLDLPPKDRWTHVVKPMAAQIHKTVYQVIDLLPKALSQKILSEMDGKEDEILDAFPAPYGDELRGIAEATGMDPAAVILYNIAYELEGGCTSLVAENSNNELFHARNLDFGLFFGWDKANETWTLAEDLRPLLFNARFTRNNVTVYNTTQFAGYIGLLTGMKTGGFSLSVDTRFDDTFYAGLIDWFKGNTTLHFLGFTTRDAMEKSADFDAAYTHLTTTPMVGPGYIILGGNKPGEGAIITRSTGNACPQPWTLKNNLHKTDYYVIETNYDHWVKTPFFDDRRGPAEQCLAQIGQKDISFASLYNLLSAQPNLNLLTTYTTLMNVAEGRFEAYRQQCTAHPCTPW